MTKEKHSGGDSCTKGLAPAGNGVSQVFGTGNLALASPIGWSYIWALSELPLWGTLQDRWTDRRMDKEKYEGEKGREALNQCSRGLSTP